MIQRLSDVGITSYSVTGSEQLTDYLLNFTYRNGEKATARDIAVSASQLGSGTNPWMDYLPAGSVAIPTTSIPGVAADFASFQTTDGNPIVYILKVPKEDALRLSNQGFSILEDEWLVFNEIPNEMIYPQTLNQQTGLEVGKVSELRIHTDEQSLTAFDKAEVVKPYYIILDSTG